MPSTPTAGPPRPTVPLRRGAAPDSDHHSTDYELSPSVVLPASVRLAGDAPDPAPDALDPDTRVLFQHRLRLCCLVAALPIGAYLIGAATDFVELFSRKVVGTGGAGLAVGVLAVLVVVTDRLSRRLRMSGTALRVAEVTVFGTVGLFFAYWQFALLTADLFPVGLPAGPVIDDSRQQQSYVLSAALIVHINWSALLLLHGMLVPNSPSRGAGVAVAMVAGAVVIDAVCVALHAPVRQNADILAAVAITMLVPGAVLSIFGTTKTAALRQEVQSAREAVKQLGQYRLRRKLGQGGMGEVYLAEHRLLKRPCAVKRIHPKYLNNPEQVRRFEREVQATARLRHPNTVEVYDYGRADDGTFYYVMEYLPGLSLEDMVNRTGPMPAARVVHLLRQVCGALKEAHRNGLIHRDIKPSNVLVFADGLVCDHAKLVDFGLVQPLTEPHSPDGNGKLTRDGLIVGTPEYMSPEQAQGLPLDERSDLFSLGSVAYFLLTGKEAFHRDNPVKTLLAVVNDEPPPVREANPTVPADVAAVVGRCLTKSLDRRFARAAELEAALAACDCADAWGESAAADWWQAQPKDAGTGTDLDSLPLRDSAG